MVSIDLALVWLWVQTGEPKLNLIFGIFGFGLNMKS